MSDGGSLMGGTLTIRHDRPPTVSTALRRVEERGGLVMPGTLLGPEGAAVWLVFRTPTPVNSVVTRGWWVVGRCLRTAQWTRASVAKFLRAHGGCLGTRNR